MSEEIYETSDVESVPERTESPGETAGDEDIIEADIDFESSMGRFNNEFVRGQINFNYELHLDLGSSGFKVSTQETVQQKIHRINRELQELQLEQLNSQEQEKVDEMIKIARNMTPDANIYKHQLELLFEQLSPEVEIQEESVSEPKRVTSSTMIELEKKISGLERRVGNLDKPLESIINDFERKVNIINNPEYHIEDIKRSINSILESTEFNRVYNSDFVEELKNQSIDELVEFLPELKNYKTSSDMIMKRLKSLNETHLNIGGSVDFVTNFQDVFNNMQRDMGEWETALEQVNQRLDALAEKETEAAEIDPGH